jgi:hypothetical protein
LAPIGSFWTIFLLLFLLLAGKYSFSGELIGKAFSSAKILPALQTQKLIT